MGKQVFRISTTLRRFPSFRFLLWKYILIFFFHADGYTFQRFAKKKKKVFPQNILFLLCFTPTWRFVKDSKGVKMMKKGGWKLFSRTKPFRTHIYIVECVSFWLGWITGDILIEEPTSFRRSIFFFLFFCLTFSLFAGEVGWIFHLCNNGWTIYTLNHSFGKTSLSAVYLHLFLIVWWKKSTSLYFQNGFLLQLIRLSSAHWILPTNDFFI